MIEGTEDLDDDFDYSIEDTSDDVVPDNNEEEEEEDKPLLDLDDSPTTEKSSDEVSFSKLLSDKFGWDNIPDDIDAITAISHITSSYEVAITDRDKIIEELQQYKDTFEQSKFTNEVEQLKSSFERLKQLSAEDFIKERLIKDNEWDINDPKDLQLLQEELEDLRLEGKIDKTYTKEFRKFEKQALRDIQQAEENITKRIELAKQQEEIERVQFKTSIQSEIQEFNSEYLEVSEKDKQWLSHIMLEEDGNGNTELYKLMQNPKIVAEMLLAYIKLPEIKALPSKLEKKITNRIVNNLSDNPLLNTKVTKTKTTSDYLDELEDVPSYTY